MSNTTLAEKAKVKTETDPRKDAAAREKLVTARIGLLLKAPFFGNLATRLTLHNADEWWDNIPAKHTLAVIEWRHQIPWGSIPAPIQTPCKQICASQ